MKIGQHSSENRHDSSTNSWWKRVNAEVMLPNVSNEIVKRVTTDITYLCMQRFQWLPQAFHPNYLRPALFVGASYPLRFCLFSRGLQADQCFRKASLRPHPVLANHHLLSHHRQCRNRIGFATVPCFIYRYPRSVNATTKTIQQFKLIRTCDSDGGVFRDLQALQLQSVKCWQYRANE